MSGFNFDAAAFGPVGPSLGPSGVSSVPVAAESLFPNGSGAGGGEPRHDDLENPCRGEGPQAGDSTFDRNSVEPFVGAPHYGEITVHATFTGGDGKHLGSLEVKSGVVDFGATPAVNNPADCVGVPAPTNAAGLASVARGAAGISGGTGAFAGSSGDMKLSPEVGGEVPKRDPWLPDASVVPISQSVGAGPMVEPVITSPGQPNN